MKVALKMVKTFMKDFNLSYDYIAEGLNKSEDYVKNIIAGKVEPTLEDGIKIARLFNLGLDDLFPIDYNQNKLFKKEIERINKLRETALQKGKKIYKLNYKLNKIYKLLIKIIDNNKNISIDSYSKLFASYVEESEVEKAMDQMFKYLLYEISNKLTIKEIHGLSIVFKTFSNKEANEQLISECLQQIKTVLLALENESEPLPSLNYICCQIRKKYPNYSESDIIDIIFDILLYYHRDIN